MRLNRVRTSIYDYVCKINMRIEFVIISFNLPKMIRLLCPLTAFVVFNVCTFCYLIVSALLESLDPSQIALLSISLALS